MGMCTCLCLLNSANTRALGRHIQVAAALEVGEIPLERGEERGKRSDGHDTNPRSALVIPTGNYGERMAFPSCLKTSRRLCSSNHPSKKRDHPLKGYDEDELLSEAEADPKGTLRTTDSYLPTALLTAAKARGSPLRETTVPPH